QHQCFFFGKKLFLLWFLAHQCNGPPETALTMRLSPEVSIEGRYLLLGDVSLTDRVDLVNAYAFSEGFSDRHIEACEQLSHRLFLGAKQHGHSLPAIMSNRHTTDRPHIADRDVAIFHELFDGRKGVV